MGVINSCPIPSSTIPPVPPTLTIRNLTVTPLHLIEVEHLTRHHHLIPKSDALTRIPSRISRHSTDSRRRVSHDAQHMHYREADGSVAATPFLSDHDHDARAAHPLDVALPPFGEALIPIPPPALHGRHTHLRMTFLDPTTGKRYQGIIPGSAHRTIVLQPARAPEDEPQPQGEDAHEFTAIYLPTRGFLALFSSANLPSWMGTLPDHLPLSALSIPGTHNSPTYHVALPSVRCQAVSIESQLVNGVRFLDVRVSCPIFSPPPEGSSASAQAAVPVPELALVHAFFPVSLIPNPKKHTLRHLLSITYHFLDQHPTETILLSLKREGTGLGTDADLAQILVTYYIPPNRSKWYISPHIPTLGEARGKIVLVRRFNLPPPSSPCPALLEEGGERGLGIDASVWPDNVPDGMCGSGLVRIQDWYGVWNTSDIRKKIQYAQEGLERAAERVFDLEPFLPPNLPLFDGQAESRLANGDPAVQQRQRPAAPPFYINFLSASTLFNINCWPDRIAVKINPSMIEYLCMAHGAPGKGPGGLSVGDAATGIVVTDWVGYRGDWDLIRCIVGWNARFGLQK